MRTRRGRPDVDLREPPGREQVPTKCLYDLEREKVFKGSEGGVGCSRVEVHLTDAKDKDGEG